MANAEHLEHFNQGVEEWNQWREHNSEIQPDLSKADLRLVNLRLANLRGAHLAYLREVELSETDLSGINLSSANLNKVNLNGATLRGADLRGADLRGANLNEAILHKANLSGANLSEASLRGANLHKADLIGINLNRVDLSGTNLIGFNLSRANLREANLREAELRGINLQEANLYRANLRDTDLSCAQALGASFDKSVFTGACLEDWNINSSTSFENAICEYVYLKVNQQERRPREGNFKPGEFAALFQQAVDTVDLIFKDGIDWQAFCQSFQELRCQYADQDFSIQAIEKKRGGAFVVRVEVPPEVDKTVVESRAKELYASEVNALEAQYEERLRLQGEHLEDARQTIEVERRDKASLMALVSTMASTQQGPKYDLSGAQFAGGFAETVQGNQIGGTINNAAAETPSLAEAAAEIQNLLKQLEASNPAATEADQTAFLNVMIPPTRRERFIGALKAASGAAIEEVPYGAMLKALVEGWQNPNG
ncbi:pentapeptide repeat-containing protein [Leptothoe sp. ISB3NOV94-8A]